MRLEIAVLSGPGIVVFLALVIFPVAPAAYYGFFGWHAHGPATDGSGRPGRDHHRTDRRREADSTNRQSR